MALTRAEQKQGAETHNEFLIRLLRKHSFQFISFAGCFHDSRTTNYGLTQFHGDTHLLHITRGTGDVMIEGKRYSLERGTVIAIPPFVEKRILYNPPFEMLNLHYRVWLENGDSLDNYALLPIKFRPEYFNQIQKILYRMKAFKLAGQPWRAMNAAPAYDVVLRHLHNHLIVLNRKPVDARMEKGYMLLSSTDYRHYDADEVASKCSLSRSQFNRMFRRCFRMSPHAYWERRRFAAIRSLLHETSRPVKQIAAGYGFEDTGYFCRWFKKMSGLTPSEFRKQRWYE